MATENRCACSPAAGGADPFEMKDFPRVIEGGAWDSGHVQGIALDTAHRYVYYSFTTVLVKTDISGRLIGTVSGLTGHLGCISFNDEDGKVYGSIEYKHDAIGQGIMAKTGKKLADEDAFYIAIFDADRIDRPGLDAERDGIMRAVYLPDVCDDFSSEGLCGLPHRYACSGIDGTGFGPDFGAPQDSPRMLHVAYGVYGDNGRTDNDCQVILRFDQRKFAEYAKPLTQAEPHHSGPRCDRKYFFHTGNTNWGVQNLEYDAFLDAWLVAVYRGKKPQFRNPPMFIIGRASAPEECEIPGLGGERGLMLPMSDLCYDGGVFTGCEFPEGSTGMYAFGNGYYCFSYPGRKTVGEGADAKRLFTSTVKLCRFTGKKPILFEEVPE